MPEAPPAPVRDIGKTPTLLETVASQMDITGAPVISARSLPSPIKSDGEPTSKPKKEEKPKPEEKPPKGEEGKKTAEELEREQQDEWKKAGESVADKLFRKTAKPKEEKKPEPEKPEPEKPKGEEGDKPKPKAEDKPAPRRRASEAEITERAAAAAAEAATKAVSKAMPRPETKPDPAAPKDPADSLSSAEQRQYVVYRELEASQPDRYKGITSRYLNSLKETQDYVKTWSKEHPGEAFNPDDETHDAFFERVEPKVDEDDWVDAKANIRAREISSKAIAPVNEKLEEMERERARAVLAPLVEQKSLEAVHTLLNEFDPAVAEAIRKPEGIKELEQKDPITTAVLNQMANAVSSLAGEIVRLEDPKAGVNFDSKNQQHRELADFIISQEKRIAALPPHERTHEGRSFIDRRSWLALPQEERSGYWYLTADHVIYLLAQKYAVEAKRIRDAEIAKFNATAERMGYKKIETGKPDGEKKPEKKPEPTTPKPTVNSPEAISKTSVNTTGTGGSKGTPSEGEVIIGKLFHTLKS